VHHEKFKALHSKFTEVIPSEIHLYAAGTELFFHLGYCVFLEMGDLVAMYILYFVERIS
jgi:hypothetical protein